MRTDGRGKLAISLLIHPTSSGLAVSEPRERVVGAEELVHVMKEGGRGDELDVDGLVSGRAPREERGDLGDPADMREEPFGGSKLQEKIGRGASVGDGHSPILG